MSCGTTGAQGWTLSTQNVTTADGQSITCGKCSAKTCPSGSSLGSKFCSSGYHLTTIGYSGNASCTKCEKTCADGYAQSPAGCGNSQGWTLGMVDSKGCGKCIAKTCDSSFSNIDCDNTVNGYRCVTCYSGNNKKGKIVSCSSLGYRCDCQTYCSNSNDSSLNSGNSNLTNPGNSSGSLQTGVIKPVQCMCYAGT